MKRTIIISLLLAAAVQVFGQDHSMERNGGRFIVDLSLDMKETTVGRNRMAVYTPRIVNGKDTLCLSSVGIMGRQRYIFYKRNENLYPEVMANENHMSSEKPDSLTWAEALQYKSWMNGATLELCTRLYGCCDDMIEETVTALGRYRAYEPSFRWLTPRQENPKIRHIEGSAYIDFVVSETEIRTDYRENRREIGKILASIDSLKADSDIILDSLFIKGFASPESPYSNNTRLAQGRTEALKHYVSQFYRFEDDFISTDFEPEDWAGLRKFVAESNIDDKESILEIIDSSLEPDPKEWKLKSTYPAQYKFLLDVCYPALRHSDYKIWYKIRQFDDINEIKKIFRERPSKLSLRELYNLGASYEPGSEEFNEVFEVAVMVYPHSETANLNAANAAMGIGDLKKAERYLSKAGYTPEAVYARGVYAALCKDFAKAKELFEHAGAIEEAREMDEFLLPAGPAQDKDTQNK